VSNTPGIPGRSRSTAAPRCVARRPCRRSKTWWSRTFATSWWRGSAYSEKRRRVVVEAEGKPRPGERTAHKACAFSSEAP
jgi:hypothetical protein